MNTPELSPCPFCGSDGEELGICADPDMPKSPARRIQCYWCNVEAPFHPSEADAIAAWNTRASPAPGRAPLTDADLPIHPEPHSFAWTDMEKRAILKWGNSLLGIAPAGGIGGE